MNSHLLVFPLTRINTKKVSIVFTWDDNAQYHRTHIAPLFLKHNWRCTFYVVPGEQGFISKYASGYKQLTEEEFEIGSHTYSHPYMSSLSEAEAENEFRQATESLTQYTGRYPLTFAFPHHDCTPQLSLQAREYHIGVRNSLGNTRRFALKTLTTPEQIERAIEHASRTNENLIFSGHSLMVNTDDREGYEPLRIATLREALNIIEKNEKAEVITFAQATLKEILHPYINNNTCSVNEHVLDNLKKRGCTIEMLRSLL